MTHEKIVDQEILTLKQYLPLLIIFVIIGAGVIFLSLSKRVEGFHFVSDDEEIIQEFDFDDPLKGFIKYKVDIKTMCYFKQFVPFEKSSICKQVELYSLKLARYRMDYFSLPEFFNEKAFERLYPQEEFKHNAVDSLVITLEITRITGMQFWREISLPIENPPSNNKKKELKQKNQKPVASARAPVFFIVYVQKHLKE